MKLRIIIAQMYSMFFICLALYHIFYICHITYVLFNPQNSHMRHVFLCYFKIWGKCDTLRVNNLPIVTRLLGRTFGIQILVYHIQNWCSKLIILLHATTRWLKTEISLTLECFSAILTVWNFKHNWGITFTTQLSLNFKCSANETWTIQMVKCLGFIQKIEDTQRMTSEGDTCKQVKLNWRIKW